MADLKLDNILIDFEDNSVLHRYVERVQKSTYKFKDSDRPVCLSASNFRPLSKPGTPPCMTDFDIAQDMRSSEDSFCVHIIQPDHYRAPEVLLGGGWSYSADIWNLGVIVKI